MLAYDKDNPPDGRPRVNRTLSGRIVDVEFSIWIASKTRWAHLRKTIAMPTVPRIGEFMKFRNTAEGDYFGWRITEVVYREDVGVEIATTLLNNIDERGYSFETEAEFDSYFASYLAEGWACARGIGPNVRYKPSPSESVDLTVEDPDDAA